MVKLETLNQHFLGGDLSTLSLLNQKKLKNKFMAEFCINARPTVHIKHGRAFLGRSFPQNRMISHAVLHNRVFPT